MMAACPNCRSQINQEQMFCRACGFRLDTGFQISTHKLGLPPTAPLQITARPTANTGAPQSCNWRYHMLPIAGFLFALFVGGFTAAFLHEEQVPQLLPTSSINTLAERSYMGVYLVSGTESYGAIVDRLVEASPAEQAGLHSGDRIIAINETEVFGTNEVVAKLSAIAPHSPIELKVQRDGETLYVPLTTARRNELNVQALCQHEGFLGVGELSAEPTTDDDHSDYLHRQAGIEHRIAYQEGVRVGMVVENSAAEDLGLQEGDIILSVNNTDTYTPEELSRSVRSISPGQPADIQIARDGEFMRFIGKIGSRE